MVYTLHTLPRPDFSEQLDRDNMVYVSRLPEPLLVQTPIITLAGPLTNDENELVDMVDLKFKKAHVNAFLMVEDHLKQCAKERKLEWFKNDELLDEVIDTAYKSFVDQDRKTVRVRVDEQLSVFDSHKNKCEPPGEGAKVKAVLELSRGTFTKTQFGTVWTLKQLKRADDDASTPYLFDPEETPEYACDITDHPLDDQTLLAAYDASAVEESL